MIKTQLHHIQKAKLQDFTNLALNYNKIHNITGAKTQHQFAKLVNDSIFPLSFLSFGQNILDVGAGAGLPSLALAIMCEQSQFHLLEPAGKKYAFLNYAKLKLELDNVQIYPQRLQDFNSNIDFDLICSKAFCSTSQFLQLSLKHCSTNTQILLYKSPHSLEQESLQYPYQTYEHENSVFLLISPSS